MEIDSAPEMEAKNDAKPGLKPSENIAQSEEESNAAKQLSLAWKDWGDSSTKAKITGFTPASITEGKTNKLTGTGDLSEAVTGATFDVTMTGAIGRLLHCSGDASASKTCHLPLNVGSLTFDALSFPIAAGKVPVSVDLSLSSLLPAALATTKTVAKATASNGASLFCMEIDSAPEMEAKNDAKPVPKPSETIAQSEAEGNGAKQLSLAWKDCGDSSTKAKITGFTPASITEGKTNKPTGTGDLSEVVTGATFDVTMTGAIGRLLHCSGDASASKTCHLPLNVGSLTFDALNFPIAAGKVPVSVGLSLSSLLPAALATTKTVAKATAQNGAPLFCTEIDSAPEMEVKNDAKPGPKPRETIAQSEAEGNAAKQLSLAWKDCGDSSTKAKITGFTPASITEGK